MDDSFRLQTELANAEQRIAALERELATIVNLLRGAERQVVQTPSGITGFNNQWMVPAMTLGAVPADEVAGVFNHPFKLFVRTVEGIHEWLVGYEGSSVTDGTNGSEADIVAAGFDAWNTFSSAQFIVLECDIDAMEPSNWTLSAISPASTNTNEVSFNDSGEQNKARLLIGKVDEVDDTATASQAAFTAQMLTHGLLNGAAVRVFESSPVHKDSL
jgi:hypothetical protein